MPDPQVLVGYQRGDGHRRRGEGHVGERPAVGLGRGRLGRGQGRSDTAKSALNCAGAVPTKAAIPESMSVEV